MIARRFAGRSVFDRRATINGIVMRASEVLGRLGGRFAMASREGS
jgi:hypothetical protein